MFVWGIVLFTLASLVAGVAQNETMMLAARAVQGLGGALAAPNALALITTTFPAGKERNRAMGVFAAMSGAGAAIGLILGGALTEIDWRWNFFINLPIGIVVAFLAQRILTESEDGRRLARRPRRDHLDRRPVLARLRPDPRREHLVGRCHDDRLPRRRCRAARRVRRHRDPCRAPAPADAHPG